MPPLEYGENVWRVPRRIAASASADRPVHLSRARCQVARPRFAIMQLLVNGSFSTELLQSRLTGKSHCKTCGCRLN